MKDEFVLTGDAAHMLDVTDERVRQLAREGKRPVIRTGRNGWHLFLREDVERLKKERARVGKYCRARD